MKILWIAALALAAGPLFANAAPTPEDKKGEPKKHSLHDLFHHAKNAVHKAIKKVAAHIKKKGPKKNICNDGPEMQKLMKPPTTTKRIVLAEEITTSINFFSHTSNRELEFVAQDCQHNPGRLDMNLKNNCKHLLFEIGNYDQAKDWGQGYKTWYSKKMGPGGKVYYIFQHNDEWVPCVWETKDLYRMTILGTIEVEQYYNCPGTWISCMQ